MKRFQIDPDRWCKGKLCKSPRLISDDRQVKRCALGHLLSQVGIEDTRLRSGSVSWDCFKCPLSPEEIDALEGLGFDCSASGLRGRLADSIVNTNDNCATAHNAVRCINLVLGDLKANFRFSLKAPEE